MNQALETLEEEKQQNLNDTMLTQSTQHMIKENDFEYEEEIKETFEIKKSNI